MLGKDILDSIQIAVSDNGFDFASKQFGEYLKKKGISLELSKKAQTYIESLTRFVPVGTKYLSLTDYLPTGNLQYLKDEPFLITGMRVFQGVAAQGVNPLLTPGIALAELQAGVLKITAGGKKNVANVPLSSFVQSTGNADATSSVLFFANPIFLESQSTLEMEVVFPTVTAGTTTHLQIQLFGIKAI